MEYIVVENYEDMSRRAAEIIAEQMKEKTNSVLGLATGSTPVGTYKNLVSLHHKGEIDFSEIVTVNLDEYVGLQADDLQSYRYFMEKNLFSHVNINRKHTFVPNGVCEDLSEECLAYDKRIDSLGGIDIQLLGIGVDGHIGFNEPDLFFTKETHVVDLDESTIVANARFFTSENDVPRKAITMGIGGIMGAKKVILIANGKHKESVVHKAFFGPITPQVPASILQLHPNVTVIFSKN